MEPLTQDELTRLDRHGVGTNGVPADHWRYDVWVNGVRQPDAIRADTKRGVAELMQRTGEGHYQVKDQRTRKLTGKVEIRLKDGLRPADDRPTYPGTRYRTLDSEAVVMVPFPAPPAPPEAPGAPG